MKHTKIREILASFPGSPVGMHTEPALQHVGWGLPHHFPCLIILLIACVLTVAHAASAASEVSGTVRVAGSGEGIEAARVTVHAIDNPDSQPLATSTNTKGLFQFTGMAAGLHRVTFDLPAGYAPTQGWNEILVDVPENEDMGGVDLLCEPTPEISGTVVDEAGAPVAGARIHAGHVQGKSRWDGQFTVTGILAGKKASIEARNGQLATTEPVPVVAGAPGAGNVRLVLRKVKSAPSSQMLTEEPSALSPVTGRVVSSEGAPVARASVYAHPTAADSGVPFSRVESGKDGRFTLPVPMECESRIRVYHPAFVETEALGVAAGTEGVKVMLKPRGEIQGTVRIAQSGWPLSRFEYFLFQQSDAPYPRKYVPFVRVQDKNGRFRIPRVAPGQYWLAIRAPGYAPATVVVVVNAPGEIVEGLRVELQRGGELRGTVLDAQDKPLQGAEIRMGESKNPFYEYADLTLARTDERGEFRLDSLSGVDQALGAYYPGCDPVSLTVPKRIISGGGPLPVTIKLATNDLPDKITLNEAEETAEAKDPEWLSLEGERNASAAPKAEDEPKPKEAEDTAAPPGKENAEPTTAQSPKPAPMPFAPSADTPPKLASPASAPTMAQEESVQVEKPPEKKERYRIYAGSYRSRAQAETCKSTIESATGLTAIIQVSLSGDEFLVFAGAFPEEAGTAAACARLKQATGIAHCFVMKKAK